MRCPRPPAAAAGVFHTYSAYARGLDILIGAYNYLDLVPKGRDETQLPWSMAWVRHHDRYGANPLEAQPGNGAEGARA